MDLAIVDDTGRELASAALFAQAPDGSADGELRVRGRAREGGVPEAVLVSSRPRGGGNPLDTLRVPTFGVPCGDAGAGGATGCFESLPFRVVVDLVDREHPSFVGGAILGALDAELVVADGDGARVFLIEGMLPRARAELRIATMQISPGGDAALPDLGVLDREVERSRAIWGVCGVDIPPVEGLAVTAPPPSFLLSVGCESPAPARGGRVAFRAGGRDVVVELDEGMAPASAARRIASALHRLGLVTTLIDNPRPQGVALGSTDLLVRDRKGAPVALEAHAGARVSSDAALDVCIPSVDLSDGLRHFTDADALVGTLEERLLVWGVADDDPRTIDVLVVPSFRGESRIGETFIGQGRGVLRNLLVLDRAAFRVAHASYTMAHELGHVLLDQPGHTDDFGDDTPTSLMDADAASPTAFGPRRLSRDECRAAHAPRAEDPVLTPDAIE